MKQLIPYFIHQQEIAEKRQGSLWAYTLFVDMSGFTRLTEGLMKEGHDGAERLSVILNEIFEPLVQLMYARGGFIPYFAGDAFTAIFPAQNANHDALSLIQTAVLARDLFEQRENTFGEFRIGLKFGLSYGELDWGIVGEERKSFYFRGSPIDKCAFCQSLAQDQEIIIHADLLQQLPNHSLTLIPVEGHDDAYKVDNAVANVAHPPPLELDDLDPKIASKFLPEAVISYNQEGEFRPVISVFISFDGIHTYEQMNAFASLALASIDSFSGYFKEIDFGDKGGVVAIFFGAPVAFENNMDRALEYVLNLREDLTERFKNSDFSFSVGMTIGTAFTGIVGGHERCQYACAGNRVNLAARLMTYADNGDILVDEDIQKNTNFRFLHKGDIKYKGIRGNVPTYKLTGRNFADKPAYSGLYVGRKKELKDLIKFSEPLFNKKAGGLVYIFGEAGIGKSRLTFELRKALQKTGVIKWFTCQTDQILRKPFNPFIYFLKNYFDQSPENTDSTNLHNFEDRFDNLFERLKELHTQHGDIAARELQRTKPIIAALIGIPYENSLWDQLDARGRYQNTLAAIINLILAESNIHPLVLEVEDTHWIDENSVELILELTRQMPNYPFQLLMTSRYDDKGQKTMVVESKMMEFLELPFLEIDLNALSAKAVKRFAEERLDGKIANEFLQLLLRTSNNNPFYLEQVLEYFRESGLLIKDETEWTIKDENVKLSNSINAILTARIDRLSAQVRETVKAAAVIGREFDVPVLSEVMKQQEGFSNRHEQGAALLKDEIKMAEQVQIWMAMNELRYIFRHSLFREAVYSMQLGTVLKQLHKLIAEAIERLYQRNIQERYADLAFHYEQAGVFDKTCEYLRKAADFSRNNYQNQQALEYYEKLLLHLGAEANSADEIKTHLKRGKLLELIGNWEESEQAISNALKLAKKSRDIVMLGKANNDYGHLLMLKGEYDEALHYLNIAAGLFESIDDQLNFAKVNGNIGNVHFRVGEYDKARSYFEASVNTEYTQKGSIGSAHIVANLGLTFMNQGQFDQGISVMQKRIPVHRAQQDKQGLATLLVNLGIVQYAKGDYSGAKESYEEGLALAEELGNKQLVAIAIGSLGLVIQQQGKFDKAMKLFEKDLEITEELGDKQGIAIALGLIGELLSEMGQFHKAIEYLQKNLMLSKELGYQKGIAKALNTLGDIFFYIKEYNRSLQFYDRAIEVTRKIDNKQILCTSLIEKGLVLLHTNQLREVQLIMEEANQLATDLGNPDLLFEAQAFKANVFYRDGQPGAALKVVANMSEGELSKSQKAEVYYLKSIFLPEDLQSRQKAHQLYKSLYSQKPKFIFKKRMEELQ